MRSVSGKPPTRKLAMDLLETEFHRFQDMCDAEGLTYVGYFRKYVLKDTSVVPVATRPSRRQKELVAVWDVIDRIRDAIDRVNRPRTRGRRRKGSLRRQESLSPTQARSQE